MNNYFIISAILGIFLSIQVLFAQPLTYSRITSGLQTPEFEGGRSDFRMDDINMDGFVDILTIGDHSCPNSAPYQHGIMVWFGDGQGNFVNFMSGDFGYGGLAVGDVNNDGFKDIGFGMHHNYSSTDFGDQILEVALGDGTGMNWAPWDDGLATNGETWGMSGTDFGDVDNDGDLDLVSISFGSGAGLHVYINQGDGSWVQSFGFLNGNSDNLVGFGDFDNDGYLDFISGHQNGTAYFGDGTGNFTNNDNGLPTLGSSASRIGISAGDINNDGAQGLAFVNASGGLNAFFFDKSTQSWVNFSGTLPATGSYGFTDIADMNIDGHADISAISGQNIKIWHGDGAGNWTLDAAFSLGVNATPKAFRSDGDLDHNGRPDIVLLAETGSWPSYQNHFYCYKETSAADSLWINPVFPKGGEKFVPGSVQFITWATEVQGCVSSTVKIEISAFGNEVPWWLLAENLPNNGIHQFIVPDFGSENVFLKFTVSDGFNAATSITTSAFQIIGNPTLIEETNDNQNFRIYPNPGSDRLFIQNSDQVKRIKLFNARGLIVSDISNPEQDTDVSRLPEGFYFYEIQLNNGKSVTGKWIKINH
jgi:hypothetical protein